MNEVDPLDYGEGKKPWEESDDSVTLFGWLLAMLIVVIVAIVVVLLLT